MPGPILRSLLSEEALALVEDPSVYVGCEEAGVGMPLAIWNELANMEWSSQWHSELHLLLRPLMFCRSVHDFLVGDVATLRTKYEWQSLDLVWQLSLDDELHGGKYQPRTCHITQGTFMLCTVGDAQLRLLLGVLGNVCVSQWAEICVRAPDSFQVPRGNKERMICVRAAQNYILAIV